MENSPTHKSKVVRAKLSQISMHLAPHPPYSYKLAPSDFVCFGYLKEKMLGLEFDSAENLLHWIRAGFERIPRAVLEDVFASWINRVEKWIQCEGYYFSKD
jgi:transposase